MGVVLKTSSQKRLSIWFSSRGRLVCKFVRELKIIQDAGVMTTPDGRLYLSTSAKDGKDQTRCELIIDEVKTLLWCSYVIVETLCQTATVYARLSLERSCPSTLEMGIEVFIYIDYVKSVTCFLFKIRELEDWQADEEGGVQHRSEEVWRACCCGELRSRGGRGRCQLGLRCLGHWESPGYNWGTEMVT